MKSIVKRNKIKFNKLIFAIGAVLLFIGIVGLTIYAIDKYNAKKPNQNTSKTTVNTSTGDPSEAPVSANDFANVPADQPREIIIPTIKVTGYIQKVGVDKSNQIAVPDNIYLAGWYTNSVKPGEPGLSIIDGHVQGRYNDAIFKSLVNLKPGDAFSVIYGDNSEKNFTVKEVKTLTVNDTAPYLMQKDPNIVKQLNLITCGGNYDNKSNQYDMRVVVKSESI
jgi:LPXTG-site transpeptidase (sortase) family protein